MNFTDSENLAISVTPHVTGALSIIGSSLITIWFLQLEKKQRNTYHRIMFAMSFMDIFGSFAYFLGQWPIQVYDTAPGFCEFQAFLIQLNAAVYYWNGILATNFMLRIVCEYKEHQTEKLEKYYHLIGWTIPVVTAFVSLGLKMYGPAGPWCWIQYSNDYGNWDWARWAFYYGELWAVMIYSFICMGLIISKVAASERNVAKSVSSGSNNNRTKQVRTQGILYITAFLITWVPGTANRIQNAVDPNNPIFALVWLQSFFVPMQGFTNFLVYIHPRYRSWKSKPDTTGCKSKLLWIFSVCCHKDDDKYLKAEYKSSNHLLNDNRSKRVSKPASKDESERENMNYKSAVEADPDQAKTNITKLFSRNDKNLKKADSKSPENELRPGYPINESTHASEDDRLRTAVSHNEQEQKSKEYQESTVGSKDGVEIALT